ncbi:MAG TPA: chemotaxis response regulator protein-glutamate methylesterase [Solibacterales bacterium]|nr:chemotaxis response regulator protein-glutamate methylesterase [Bryobacterales bacterium]
MTERKIKVLIVDDSAIVRKLLSEALAKESDIEVVGTAPDPYVARDKILALSPDVMTLDIEMPRMDGLTFLKKVMEYRPTPSIVISSLGQSGCQHALEALRIGAVEVLCKPGGPYSVGDFRNDLPAKIRAAAAARLQALPAAAALAENVTRPPAARPAAAPVPAPAPAPASAPAGRPAGPGRKLIAIGASTGGTEAIYRVLSALPEDMPPIVIVQHIPANFSRAFAQRLNQQCRLRVREASDGDFVGRGEALIAPGNFHMSLVRRVDGFRVSVYDGERVCYQRPAVDVLFQSVARELGRDAAGVLLTGMGSDGAQGMLAMHKAGAFTIAQDEASCVVFGMPKEAIRLGAADSVLALDRIASHLVQLARGPAAGTATSPPPGGSYPLRSSPSA